MVDVRGRFDFDCLGLRVRKEKSCRLVLLEVLLKVQKRPICWAAISEEGNRMKLFHETVE